MPVEGIRTVAPKITLDNLPAEEYADLVLVAQGEQPAAWWYEKYNHGDGLTRRLLKELRARLGLAAEIAPRRPAHRQERALAEERPPDPEAPEVLLRDMDDDDEDVERLIKLAESYQYRIRKREMIPFDHSIDLATELPVLICWVADMHVGAARSDLRKIRESLETVRDTPGMYVIFGGDDGENTTSSRASHGAHHERLLPTKTERRFVEYFLQLPGFDENGMRKTLGVGEGNHTGRSIQDDGESWLQRMCEVNGLHYYGYRQRFHLRVGRHTYRIICAHRHRGGGLDQTRPAKKLMEDWGEADIVWTAHRHAIATSQEYIRLELRGFGQAGSFKDYDDYTASRGYPPAMPAMPGAILFPHEHYFVQVFDAFHPIYQNIFRLVRQDYEERLRKKAK